MLFGFLFNCNSMIAIQHLFIKKNESDQLILNII